MNIEDVKKLANIVRKSELSLLEISEGDFKIRIEYSAGAREAHEPAKAPAPAYVPVQNQQAQGQEGGAVEVMETNVDFNKLHEIKSPMVGVFYTSPSPTSPPFVKKGDSVKQGDVLCIVEAMKLMNEITADADGEIIDVCVANGDVVEYGQTLFKLC